MVHMTTDDEFPLYDAAVIGGGFAGLSAAVALGRSLRRVAVIDDGDPRNAPSPHAHNVLGREGAAPRDLLAAGRAEATAYGAEFVDGRVATAARIGEHFLVTLADGRRLTARRILLATGLHDVLPEVPGLPERWGIDVLHCPYCHGYEVRGQRIVVLGTSPMAAHGTLLFRQLSPDVTLLLTDPAWLEPDDRERLLAIGVRIVDGTPAEILAEDDRLGGVRLADGSVLPADAVVVAPRMEARGELFEQLGGGLTDHPVGRFVEVDALGKTAVDGVYAAGNTSNLAATVTVASGAGMMAGAAINGELAMLDATRAVHQGKSSGVDSSTTRADWVATETTSPTAS